MTQAIEKAIIVLDKIERIVGGALVDKETGEQFSVYELDDVRQALQSLRPADTDALEYMVYSFKSESVYELKPRGNVYVTHAPHEYVRSECPFMGKKVLIDGNIYTVKAVESYAVCPVKKGAVIGLLVDYTVADTDALGALELLDTRTGNDNKTDEWRNAYTTVKAALMANQCPDGWQLVPKQPTDQMYVAWEEEWLKTNQANCNWHDAYYAMLSAAPQPPKGE